MSDSASCQPDPAPTAKKSVLTFSVESGLEPLVAELERLAPLSAELPEDLRKAVSDFAQSYSVDQVVEGNRVFRVRVLPPFELAAAALRALRLNLLGQPFERAQARCVYQGAAYRSQAENDSADGNHHYADDQFRRAAIEYDAAGLESDAQRCRDQIRAGAP